MVKKVKPIKQYVYLALVVAFLMLPNLLLIIIGEDSVTATFLKKGVYFLLGCSLLVLPLIFIKPKHYTILGLLLLPFLLVELFHIYQFKVPSTEEALASFFLTNYGEAYELFEGNFQSLLIVVLLLLIYLFLIRQIKSSFVLSKKVKIIIAVSSSLIFILLHGRNFIMANKIKDNFDEAKKLANYSLGVQLRKVFPTDITLKLKSAYNGVQEKKNYLSRIEGFEFNAKKNDTLESQEIYVLVIGETARKHNFGVYGYERKTTPNFDTISNIINFDNVNSSANLTSLSIPFILTRATPKNTKPKLDEPAVLTPFKEAGFKTYWLSNIPSGVGSVFGFYSSLADSYKNMSLLSESSNYDEVLIPELDNILRDTSSNKKFIVVHTLGSHFRYNNRYPESFEAFKPNLERGLSIENSISIKNKDKIINSYDNSILYTDYVLSQFISKLKKQNAISFLYYISDHGENLYDDESEKILHAYINPSKYEIEIPLIVWYSKEYNDIYSSKVLTLNDHKNKSIMSTNSFHTLLDIANISYPDETKFKSFGSRKFDSISERLFYKTDKTLLKLD